MTLKVVGAGLGRTGTYSLKLALEQLLGGPCYHMAEVWSHPEHIPLWRQCFKGILPKLDKNVAYENYQQYPWALRIAALICFFIIIILPIIVSVFRVKR